MVKRLLAGVLVVATGLTAAARQAPDEQARMEAQNAALRAMLLTAPKLPMTMAPINVVPPTPDGWALGMVSWVAAGSDGLMSSRRETTAWP